jgi:23S rRNA (cytidine1920-2'-O)/16S rRNA (cytidine1409-2'-O)-methyltransferase
MKSRLDQVLVAQGLVSSRSQAESYIKLGNVLVNGKEIRKPGFFIDTESTAITLNVEQQYVSRAALKLASVAEVLHLTFNDKVVLDVGSSTGGFTDYALRHGARKAIDVEVGTNQLHPSLRDDPRIELHEQTDIRDIAVVSSVPDVVVIDVSFISLRDILPHIVKLSGAQTEVIAMVKPQFEAQQSSVKHKGVIKNDRIRREILKDFENWVTAYFRILDKADSSVAGAKGNQERFYKLKLPQLHRTSS